MTKLHFQYSMKLYYSEPVDPCYFTIKCIPRNTDRQRLLKIAIDMDPSARYTQGTDGFGNNKIIGAVRQPHEHYYLDVAGEVEIGQVLYEEIADDLMLGAYKYPYGKTKCGDSLYHFANKLLEEIEEQAIIKDYNKALYIMQRVHESIEYDISSTDVDTTAEEAFEIGKGVCQDYAHIFISLARYAGIPARYVTGLMIGEGQSHAWVEVVCSGKWIGLDPTNKLLIDDNYIKLGHGRDASDCKINLGIMRGGGNQRQEIEVTVWKEDKKDD